MTTIYVVTRGEYSDYRIVGIFSTQEGASAAAAVINQGHTYTEAQVEEYELDAYVDHYLRGELLYTVLMFRDGNGTSYASGDPLGEEVTDFNTNHRNQRYLRVSRWATSEEAVMKIANELRAQKIALGEWE